MSNRLKIPDMFKRITRYFSGSGWKGAINSLPESVDVLNNMIRDLNTKLEIVLPVLECKIDNLSRQIVELRNINKGATMELETIENTSALGALSSNVRWERIANFEHHVRSLKECYYIGNDEVLCRVLGRYWMFFSGQDGYLANHLMAHGYWELSCTEFIATEVQAGMTVIDAGANVGYYSVLMGDKIGESGFLYAVEPIPALRENIEKSFFLNGLSGRFHLCTAPLWSAENVEIKFSVPQRDTKNARVIADGHPAETSTTLRTTTIDALVPPGSKVDFIKVDVEGAEHELWRGMRRVLSESPDILVFLEYNAGRLQDPSQFLDDVVTEGFRLKRLDPLTGPVDVSKDQLLSENFGQDWMLVLKR